MRFHPPCWLVASLLAATLTCLAACSSVGIKDTSPRSELVLPTEPTAEPDPTNGYTRAAPPARLDFPADFGSHPDFQTEWWYYTGNLETPTGRHFGFQLTFFRRALLPPGDRPARVSNWAADQVYLAHFTLSDIESERFLAFERSARGAVGLAGAQTDPYNVWLYGWHVQQVGERLCKLYAAQDEITLDLQLEDLKGPVLQGNQGYSQKGPDPGNASYYFSQTRLSAQGTLKIGEQIYPVSGLSWMDHEFSTSALAPNQVGWDWFSLQLHAGSVDKPTGSSSQLVELMVYQIRRKDGSIDPFSKGALILENGTTRQLQQHDFEIQVLGTWKSPQSGAIYPSRWQVTVPSLDLDLEIEPYLKDQELNLSFTYWEGAVKIQGVFTGQAVSGSGYVELTGYADSIAGEF